MPKRLIAAAVVLFLAAVAVADPRQATEATFATGSPATTNNDDSCDIGLYPAATLLLPYFEVDVVSSASSALTTLVAITNVTAQPQIAHVTMWTDRAFPVLDFHVFLTGYDVQALNLRDVLVMQSVAPPSGTSSSTARGSRSVATNPNFAATATTNCASLPGTLDASLMANVRSALTTGNFGSTMNVGNVHTNAIGYLTIDVVDDCVSLMPTDPAYHTTQLLFDNVLIGDAIRVAPGGSGNFAGIEPLVHIRAVPEGGAVGSNPGTNLPFTFYDRYTPAGTPKIDRRQPLPSRFASRLFEGGVTSASTALSIWREGTVAGNTTNVAANATVPTIELVRFDERENPTVMIIGDPNRDNNITVGDVFYLVNVLFVTNASAGPAGDANNDGAVSVGDIFYLVNYLFSGGAHPGPCGAPPCRAPSPTLPVASRVRTDDGTVMPPYFSASGDVGGWIYLNLNSGVTIGSRTGARAGVSQNWVTTSTSWEGRYSTERAAHTLGNGCSLNDGLTTTSANPIGPSANTTP